MSQTLTLEQIYDLVPSLRCQGKCISCCQNIPLYSAELSALTARHPQLKAEPYKDMGGFLLLSVNGSPDCPLLKNGRCSDYQTRPLICRIWGVVERMRCPYGCIPDRFLSDMEAHTLLGMVREMEVDDG